MNQAQTIALYQPLLQTIALKMVGSIHDAEDIVQDTFLKWLSVDQQKVQNTKSYLVRAVTNNCLNHLNSLNKKKNEFLDTINPGALIEKYKEASLPRIDLESELSVALQVLHHKLEPVEKAVYILRELFNVEYEVIQEIVDKKTENCRQLLSRAKDKLDQGTRKFNIDKIRQAQFLETFKKASAKGYLSALINELHLDIKAKLPKLG